MKRRVSDEKIIDTVIAMDTAFIALFHLLREREPALSMELSGVLLRASQKQVPGIPGALAHIGQYAEILSRPPTAPTAH